MHCPNSGIAHKKNMPTNLVEQVGNMDEKI